MIHGMQNAMQQQFIAQSEIQHQTQMQPMQPDPSMQYQPNPQQ